MERQNNYKILSIKTATQLYCTAIIIGLLIVSTSAQTNLIAKKYLKIKPTISTRDDVEKLLGKSDPKQYTVLYQTTDSVIRITYSSGDCNTRAMAWGIPEWKVERVSYVPRDEYPLRLRNVILNFSKFKKLQAGDVLVHIDYYNNEAGVTVGYDKKEKIVNEIIIYLTLEQKEHFACIEK